VLSLTNTNTVKLSLTFLLLISWCVRTSASVARRLTLSSLRTNFQRPIQFFDKGIQSFRVFFFRGQLAKLTPISFFFTVGHENTKARAVPYLGLIFHLQAMAMEGSYEWPVGRSRWLPYEKSARTYALRFHPTRLYRFYGIERGGVSTTDC